MPREHKSCDTNAIFPWHANGRGWLLSAMHPVAQVRLAPLAPGYFWSCDDQYGFADTLDRAKARAEAVCRHRHWFGARHVHPGNAQAEEELREERRERARRLWGEDYAA